VYPIGLAGASVPSPARLYRVRKLQDFFIVINVTETKVAFIIFS